MKISIQQIKNILSIGVFCIAGTSVFAQSTSDAVYEAPSSNTTKFYKEMAGTNATTNFSLGDAIFAQFLFTEHPTIPLGEIAYLKISCKDQILADLRFKEDDVVLPIYFSDTYSLDVMISGNTKAFTDLKSLTEATLTDRKLSTMTYWPGGTFQSMFPALCGKLKEGSNTIKISLETGKDEWDDVKQIKVFKASKTLSSGELTFTYKNDQLESYRKDFLANYGEVMARGYQKTTDNGVKTDIHKQNIEKVVFSSTAITDGASTSSLKTSFAGLTDGIYGKIYMPISLNNKAANLGVSGSIKGYQLEYYLDGELITKSFQELSESMVNTNTSFDLAVCPKGDISDQDKSLVYQFAKTLVKAKPGKHTFKTVVSISSLNPFDANISETVEIANGSYELNVTEADRDALLKRLCPPLDYYNVPNNVVANSFSMIDKEKKSNEKVLKVVVYDNDWTYKRNIWGTILSRLIRGKAIIQNTTTGLCFEIDITYYQENISSGGSDYGSTTFSRWGEYDGSVWFSASCIK